MFKGFQSVFEVIYQKPSTMDVINDLVKNLLLGFAIVEHTSTRCLIKNISQEMDQEIDKVLKRAFMVTVSMGESLIEAIEKRLDQTKLVSLEKTNNQLTNFCERVLNKKGYHDYDKTCFVYVIAWNLEKACDQYKYICEMNKDLKNITEIMEKVNNQIRGYSALLTKFSEEDLVELNRKRKEIVKEIRERIGSSDPDEIMALAYLNSLALICEDFSTSMFMLKKD